MNGKARKAPRFIIESDQNPSSALFAGEDASRNYGRVFYKVSQLDKKRWAVELISGRREQLFETINMAGFEIKSEEMVSY